MTSISQGNSKGKGRGVEGARGVGQSVPRKEGGSKVVGAAQYIDDLIFPEMIYGTTVRSPVPRGKVKEIKFREGIPWDEFTIVSYKDIPGKNYVALILEDQPYLAKDVVNHAEEPIILLAHPDKHLLEEARKSVEVRIDPLPVVFTIEDSNSGKETIWGDGNVFKSFLVNKGDVDLAWDRADFIVEGTYETGAQEQLYIENNGVIAVYEKESGVTVWGSLQCPYYVQKAIKELFNFSDEKVRVIQTVTGGGFGGKEEYPSMLSGHAALLAYKSGKPVKMIYDRAEDMVATTKRHPSQTRHKTAVSRDGKLLAMDIEFLLDGGAYATLSSVVLSRGTIHAAGPYACPNVRIRSRALATNLPPHGAFRGFGAPQSIFALERHMEKIAKTIGIGSDEIRRRNFLKDGDTTATQQPVKGGVNMNALMERALDLSNYREKLVRYRKENEKNPIKRGVGFATFMHGAGFTGSGERYLASVVGIEGTEEGKVRVLAASTEIGQGTNTVFSQIVSDVLNIEFDDVEVAQPDTARVPNSGPTVASRTVMIVGKLVESAALGIKQILLNEGELREDYSREDFVLAVKNYIQKNEKLRFYSEYKAPSNIYWDDEAYKGDAYATYAWACYVAEVKVDTRTLETEVTDFVAVQDIGKVVHPVLAAGQIEGGVAQGIGYALYENVVWREGRMANNRMTNYIMPTTLDVPPIRVFFEEGASVHGPSGAKGIGELPLDGTAPAILNAIENATGVRSTRIPLVPEQFLEEWEKNDQK